MATNNQYNPNSHIQLAKVNPRTLAIVFLFVCGFLSPVSADVVNISTTVATGTGNRVNADDFIGLLSNVAPTQIGGLAVTMPNVPGGEAFQVGDIVGRDIDASGGGRTWEYLLTLPGDAVAGTGLESIFFAGHAFENSVNNLEGTDQLRWELFLNGSAVSVDSGGTGAGIDFTFFDINLSNIGGATINQVRVVMTVDSMNANIEWFAARGVLSATYTAIPEPGFTIGLWLAAAFLYTRRGRSI